MAVYRVQRTRDYTVMSNYHLMVKNAVVDRTKRKELER